MQKRLLRQKNDCTEYFQVIVEIKPQITMTTEKQNHRRYYYCWRTFCIFCSNYVAPLDKC